MHQSDTTLPSSEKARKNIFEFPYKSEKFSHNYSQEVVSASGWKFPRTKSSNSVSCIQQETTAEAIESALDVHLATDNLATGHRKGNVYRKNKNILFPKKHVKEIFSENLNKTNSASSENLLVGSSCTDKPCRVGNQMSSGKLASIDVGSKIVCYRKTFGKNCQKGA